MTVFAHQKCKRSEKRIGPIIAAVICAAAIVFPAHSIAKEPPVILLPLSAVEPPRDVAAESWHSPYCAHWNDGCTECLRASKDQASKCSAERDSGRSEEISQQGECKRRAIICFREMDATYFDRICRSFYIEHFYKTENGAMISLSYVNDVSWLFDGKQFTAERGSPFSFRGSTYTRHLAVGPAKYLLSDNGYVLLSRKPTTGHHPAAPVFDPRSFGLRCTQSYESSGQQ